MKSPQFRCPHCRSLLTKSDADQVLGESGYFVSFASSKEACPACGETMDRLSIIKGEYDEKQSPGGGLTTIAIVIILGIIGWLILR